MNAQQTRRDFLRAAGVAVLATASSSARAVTVPTRKDLRTLDAADKVFKSFGKAYKAMSGLPDSHKHNWSFQANIHGVPDSPRRPDALWDQCQHGGWWFFPWHRMYLHFMERLIRKYSEDDDFAFPYWNWSDEKDPLLKVHAAFLEGQPLYVADRSDPANSGKPFLDYGRVVGQTQAALQEPRFTGRQGRVGFGGPYRKKPTHKPPASEHGELEGGPHDAVHDGVSGFMGAVETSARDPLFWAHHANVDRLWLQWLAQGPGEGEDWVNPPDDLWLDWEFSFYNEREEVEAKKVRDVLDTTKLNYVYDDQPKVKPGPAVAVKAPPPVREVASLREGYELGARPLTLVFRLKDAVPALQGVAEGSAASSAEVRLVIAGVRLPKGRRTFIDAYLNLPKGRKPATKDPHYAGTLSFFGHGHGHGGLSSGVTLNRVIRALRKAGEWKEKEIAVTLVAAVAGGEGKAPDVSFKSLSLRVGE